MSCSHRASLIITREVDGTSTSIARDRRPLVCCLPDGHVGEHRDEKSGETWNHDGKELTHILRHEEGE